MGLFVVILPVKTYESGERNMQEKIWEYKSKQLNKDDILALSENYGLPTVISCILLNRGIRTNGDVTRYLKKGLDCIHNPFDFDDMDKATERILSAVDNGEKIVVYGDYDVDGITATSVLYKFLKKIGADVEFYIPDRMSEGYGVNVIAVNKLIKKGVKLFVTVDCGITSVGEVEFAKTIGADFVITDHHTCKEEIPRAVAVINPKRPDSSYGFDALAGVGVAFKLVLALCIRLGLDTKAAFMEYADLVAIGTIADVVSLLGENRVIVERGINALANTSNPGIKALLEVAGLGGKTPDSQSVAFGLSPRLNAAGRMANAGIAVELLTEENPQRAMEIAVHLDQLNRKRQDIEKKIYQEALLQAESFTQEQSVYVLSSHNWHSGIIGIVASKLSELFYRPCILISIEDGKGKASGRSIEEMNLFDALSHCEELLTAFGGHSQAAGLSISEENIDAFRTKINEYAKNCFRNKTLVPRLYIDCPVDTKDITLASAKMIARLEPFGMGNEVPVFSAKDMRVLTVQTIGQDNKHLRLYLSDGKNKFNAIGFNMGEMVKTIRAGYLADIAFSLNVNLYNGVEYLQLVLKDVKAHSE